MTSGFPDWTRALVLLGWDGTQFIPVLLDTDGNMSVLMRGEDAGGTLRTVRVDTDAQIIMVPRGASGNYMAVDASGFLTTVMKGDKGAGALETVALDANGQIIMVPRGASGNYMAVDASGFLTTVFKGDYEGSLRTVTLDDDGRISAFVYDTIDAWGQIQAIGFAELAARLGSPVLYERSGQVYFLETFEHGAQRWTLTTSGTGASIGLSPESCMTGGYSLKCVGGSSFNYNVRADMQVGTMPVGRMGFSLSVAFPGSFDELECLAYLYTGTVAYSIFWRLDDANTNLDVYEKDTGWTKVDDLVLSTRRLDVYNTIKLVVDLSTSKYVRLRVNAIEADLSAWDVYSAADASAPCTEWQITFKSRSGNNDIAYLDDLIVTVAEP